MHNRIIPIFHIIASIFIFFIFLITSAGTKNRSSSRVLEKWRGEKIVFFRVLFIISCGKIKEFILIICILFY